MKTASERAAELAKEWHGNSWPKYADSDQLKAIEDVAAALEAHRREALEEVAKMLDALADHCMHEKHKHSAGVAADIAAQQRAHEHAAKEIRALASRGATAKGETP